MAFELTWNRGGLLEGSSNIWIHIDHDILLDGDLLVPGIDSICNPVRELLTKNWSRNIHKPLLGELFDFFLDGEITMAFLPLDKEADDAFKAEALILRNIEVLYLGILHDYKAGKSKARFYLHFLFPPIRSLRKLIVMVSYGGR